MSDPAPCGVCQEPATHRIGERVYCERHLTQRLRLQRAAEEAAPVAEAEAPAKPKRVRKKAAPKVAAEPVAEEASAAPEPTPAEEPATADTESATGETPRRGWWQRTFGA